MEKEDKSKRGGKWLFATVRKGMSDIGKKFSNKGEDDNRGNGVETTGNGSGSNGVSGGKYRI